MAYMFFGLFALLLVIVLGTAQYNTHFVIVAPVRAGALEVAFGEYRRA
jgi:hypothetical protein